MHARAVGPRTPAQRLHVDFPRGPARMADGRLHSHDRRFHA
jgi:hypothetical protein